MYLVLFWLSCFLSGISSTSFVQQQWQKIQPSAPNSVQTEAVNQLMRRVIPESFHDNFVLNVDRGLSLDNGLDVVELVASGGSVTIWGSSGVAVAWGLNHYVKYVCHCHIGWQVSQLSLPQPLPNAELRVESLDTFRYYLNECTAGYTTPWWGEEEWRSQVDWMALNGINMPLAPTGQEAIQRKVYMEIGLTEEEIDSHFVGPAFLPWGRMGNIRGWGGPLSEGWHLRSIDLQHKILDYMRELGMTPVLPGFAGHVPQGLLRIFPNMSYEVESWVNLGFTCNYTCTVLLDPMDPVFKEVGGKLMKAMIEEFGTDHLYSSDPYNEMNPHSNSTEYIRQVGAGIYQTMTEVDPESVWVLQGWMFYYASYFWQVSQAEALLTSTPIGSIIILDLDSVEFPQYQRLQSYFGQPFIFNMLHNFGGNNALYGRVQGVITGPNVARNTSISMIGTGMAPEGLFTSYVMYDLMSEMSWSSSSSISPDTVELWFQNYATRRYGLRSPASDGMALLSRNVYNCRVEHYHDFNILLVDIPSLNATDYTWYPIEDLLTAWDLFISSADMLSSSAAYRHDLVDLTRQVLINISPIWHKNSVTAHFNHLPELVHENAMVFMDLLDDLDQILGTDPQFLLGRWLEAAKNVGSTMQEKDQYEKNARNQITLWGPDGQILDYAYKQWSGMVSHYYKPRWQLFYQTLIEATQMGGQFDQENFKEIFMETIGKPFCKDKSLFPVEPQGSSIGVGTMLHRKWRNAV